MLSWCLFLSDSLYSFPPVVLRLPYTLGGLLYGVFCLLFILLCPILLLLFVFCCRVCPSLIVAQSGGGDGFLYHPSRIPFLNVVRPWSPFATASGSVAFGSLLFCCIYSILYYRKFRNIRRLKDKTAPKI